MATPRVLTIVILPEQAQNTEDPRGIDPIDRAKWREPVTHSHAASEGHARRPYPRYRAHRAMNRGCSGQSRILARRPLWTRVRSANWPNDLYNRGVTRSGWLLLPAQHDNAENRCSQ